MKGKAMERKTTNYLLRILLPLCLLALLLTGCRTVKVVPVTEYRDRYVSRTDSFLKVDSIYLHDSVAVYTKGDTVYLTKTQYKDRLKYVKINRTDTVTIHDSIPYRVTVTVEKQRTWIEKVTDTAGKVALALCAVLVIAVVCYLLRRHRNNAVS
jgi:hypothetical protein